MKRYKHGGKFSPDIIYDFSVNTNPLGMPESVKRVLAENVEKFSEYPDPDSKKLTEKISEHENIPPENIVCGNGAADLIYRIVYSVRPNRALLLAPAFSEYEKALSEIGCEICYHYLSEDDDFTVTEKIFDSLNNCDIFFLCSPNNPTGKLICPSLLAEISEYCRTHKILFIVDECFLGFTENSDEYAVKINSGTVVLKAFTKLYAMAGLRLGYALFGDTELSEKVNSTGQCWSVSVPAQLAGIAALSEADYVNKTVDLIKNEREFLTRELTKLGIKVYPSDTNFLLFYSNFPLAELLRKQKISVRNCGNFIGLNEKFIRIAVKNHSENETLINAVKNIFKGGKNG